MKRSFLLLLIIIISISIWISGCSNKNESDLSKSWTSNNTSQTSNLKEQKYYIPKNVKYTSSEGSYEIDIFLDDSANEYTFNWEVNTQNNNTQSLQQITTYDLINDKVTNITTTNNLETTSSTTTISYNENGWVESYLHTAPSGNNSSNHIFKYDNNGNIVTEIEEVKHFSEKYTNYTYYKYDELSRLKNVKFESEEIMSYEKEYIYSGNNSYELTTSYTDSNVSNQTNITYDEYYNPINTNSEYKYDKNGNVIYASRSGEHWNTTEIEYQEVKRDDYYNFKILYLYCDCDFATSEGFHLYNDLIHNKAINYEW